jgi:cysteine-rich repeat protein
MAGVALVALSLAACSLDFDGYHLAAADGGADAAAAHGADRPGIDHDAASSAPLDAATDAATAVPADGNFPGDAAVRDAGGDDAGGGDAAPDDASADDAGDAATAAVCGDGTAEGSELCDGDCPTSCDDGDPCTAEELIGSDTTCDAHCVVTQTITTPASGDQCCPAGANANNDSDCQPICGNGALESGETCDDHNRANGDNCDPSCSYFNDLSLLSGRPGHAGHSDGSGSQARFDGPQDIAADGNVLYVADLQSSVIRKIASNGDVTTLAGQPYDEGACDGSATDNGIGTAAHFCAPTSLAVVGDKLWVVDSTSFVAGLRVIDLTTGAVSYDHSLSASEITVVKGHRTADGSTLLFYDGALKHWDPSQPLGASNPQVLATKQDISAQTGSSCSGIEWLGSSFYLGCGNKVLRVNGGVVSVYAGGGTSCADNGSDRLSAGIGGVSDLTTDGTALYVADPGCEKIRVITNGVSTFSGDGIGGNVDGAASIAEFGFLAGIAYVAGSGFFVSDETFSEIRKVTTGGAVSTWAGSGTNLTTVYAAQGPSCRYSARFPRSHSLATDGTYAYFWLSNDNPSVVRVDLQTGGSQPFANSASWSKGAAAYPPADLAVLDGFLYLALNGSIWRVPLADGSSPARYAGTDGSPGAGDAPIGTATLQPKLLAADPASKTLYFFDANNTLRRINTGAASPSVLTLGGVAGATAIMDADLQSAQFASPFALTFDGTYLYALDGTSTTGRRVVRQIDLSAGNVTTVVGMDVDEPRRDGIGTDARLFGGLALASDDQRLFIAEQGNGDALDYDARIREVALSTFDTSTMIGRDDRASTIAGVGRAAGMYQPQFLAFDPVGRRLLIYDPIEGAFLQVQ